MLERGRELCAQASNGTNSTSDKEALHKEIDQLNSEVTEISNNTEFNTKKLLNTNSITNTTNEGSVVQYLKQGWLEQSEKLIKNYYGIQADGVDLTVKFVNEGAGGTLAYVSSSVGSSGKGTNLTLNIDMDDFTSPSWPNGGNPPQYNDRVIAHEMTHAVMARTTDWGDLVANANWLVEGTAEFIQGGDERVSSTLSGGSTVADLVSSVVSGWANDNDHYSGGYAAVQFLHQHIKTAGGTGIKDLFDELKSNPNTETLDLALKNLANGAYSSGLGATDGSTANSFYKDWLDNGANFISAMNLTNSDTGAIGGADADGGSIIDAEDAVPDVVNLTDNLLSGFNVIWPEVSGNSYNPISIQIGANSGQTMDIILHKVDSETLGISKIDVVNNASIGIDKFDRAIASVSGMRSNFGAIQNRLEHAKAVNDVNYENTSTSESRIRDTDMAKEMMKYSKENILNQAAQVLLAQSNQKPQAILELLR